MSNNPFQDTQPYAPGSQGSQFDPAVQGQPVQAKSSFPWGCLLGGCLGIMLLGLLAVGGVIYVGWNFYSTQLAKYTSDQPVELPSVNITDEEVQAIETKLEDFRQQFESGETPQELVLTVDEINALIASNADLKGRVHVKIVEGKLHGDLSFPLDEIPGGKGRYFNGSVTLEVELDNGVLVARLADAQANNQPIPSEFLEAFRKENLAKGIYDNPETAKALARCESLEILEDRIVLKVRQKSNTASGEAKPEGQGAPDDQTSGDANSNPQGGTTDQ